MRISDWSSDVCSSDLQRSRGPARSPSGRAELLIVVGPPVQPGEGPEVANPPHAGEGVERQHAELPQRQGAGRAEVDDVGVTREELRAPAAPRSDEHTSELQSLMRISYAVFCLKKKTV